MRLVQIRGSFTLFLCIYYSKQEENLESLEHHVQTLVQEDPDIELSKHREDLQSLFGKSSAKNTIEKRLYKYLQYNSHHLPMYAKPDMI